ncbi:MAG: hypothetical protein QOH61_1914 [Chloroflexota bacterium]|jgi:transcriptional regulator with XRE-family HTH domain|nr:hypothetical protein [Chloroflexota bacterium]
MASVNPKEAGRALRAIRRRQGKRLSDVAVAARLSRSTASRVERGEWDGITYRSITAVAAALDAALASVVSWHGAALDRLLDEGHARLVGLVVKQLRALGWVVAVEVSYSVYGERGSIDVPAWHPGSATLLVIEVKSELGSVEGLLRPLDAKVRLAAGIAREQFGWQAARVARIVVFPEDRTIRRQVERHRVVLEHALPAGNVEIRGWLRVPSGALRGRWFLTLSRHTPLARNPSAIRRVKGRSGASSEHESDGQTAVARPQTARGSA